MNKENIQKVVVGLMRVLPNSGLSYEEGIVALKATIATFEKIDPSISVEEANSFIDTCITSLMQKPN